MQDRQTQRASANKLFKVIRAGRLKYFLSEFGYIQTGEKVLCCDRSFWLMSSWSVHPPSLQQTVSTREGKGVQSASVLKRVKKKSRSIESLKYYCVQLRQNQWQQNTSESSQEPTEGEPLQAGKGNNFWCETSPCWFFITLWALHERRHEHQALITCHLENNAHVQCLDHKMCLWLKWNYIKIRTWITIIKITFFFWTP